MDMLVPFHILCVVALSSNPASIVGAEGHQWCWSNGRPVANMRWFGCAGDREVWLQGGACFSQVMEISRQ